MTIRRVLYALMGVAISLMLMGGCFRHDNHGYPSHVSFGRDGGEKVLSGDASFIGISILSYSGSGNSDTGFMQDADSLMVEYHWLTAKASRTGNQLTLIAAPIEKGQPRKLYVTGDFGPDYAEITVTHK